MQLGGGKDAEHSQLWPSCCVPAGEMRLTSTVHVAISPNGSLRPDHRTYIVSSAAWKPFEERPSSNPVEAVEMSAHVAGESSAALPGSQIATAESWHSGAVRSMRNWAKTAPSHSALASPARLSARTATRNI